VTKRTFLFVLSIFFIGIDFGLFLSQQSNVVKTNKPVEITREATSTAVVAGLEMEKAHVARVIDGDTIELTDKRKVRYIGIDTPETVDPYRSVGCFGKEAAEINRQLVFNKDVEMEIDTSQTDKFGRLLRYVYVELSDFGRIMVNEYLVAQGYATSNTFPPDVKYQDRFYQAQTSARSSNKGLWSSCTTESSSKEATVSTQFISETDDVKDDSRQETSVTNSSPCKIKGNISSGGKIYHLPSCGSYDKTVIDETVGERWFCTEEAAVQAGWRKAKNC